MNRKDLPPYKNYDYLPPVYPPSEYIFYYFDEDLREVSDIFAYYDMNTVLNNPTLREKLRLWNKVEYIKPILERMFKIFNVAHRELRMLERYIDKAEKEYGIEIVPKIPSATEEEKE